MFGIRDFQLIFVIVIACLWFYIYWKAAEIDKQSRLIWAGLSLLISVLTVWILGWRWLGLCAAQLALGLGITLVRVALAMRKKEN